MPSREPLGTSGSSTSESATSLGSEYHCGALQPN